MLPSPISHIGSQKTHIGSQKTGAPEGEDAYRKKNQWDKESTRPCCGGRHDKAAAVAMTKETARPPPKIGQNTSSYGLESTKKTDSFRGKSTVERTWVARRPFKAPAGIRTPPCVWASEKTPEIYLRERAMFSQGSQHLVRYRRRQREFSGKKPRVEPKGHLNAALK